MHTALEDGSKVCIRTPTKDDNALMRTGLGQMSPRSLYLRFFSGARTPPDWVIDRLLEVDGHNHLAWGAINSEAEGKPAIGIVHAFRSPDQPECAEFSVAVIDSYHGLGLGKLLTATILLDARREGLTGFTANTLAENTEAIDFTKSLGGKLTSRDGAVNVYAFDIDDALAALKAECDPPGIAEVFRVLGSD
ncbi:GNAT family N-acetyltransferase [Altererythrobacter gangjinensis]|uniref:GNAT family N-acetyltransferase n=1 Tax=Pontixanthobacter gangjinensis TaxID=1028742 RepID=A0A6I4SL62_9SPHN|nr:GNAT family N-acetyltransferase [Pontixanthobacter gangjinensis]